MARGTAFDQAAQALSTPFAAASAREMMPPETATIAQVARRVGAGTLAGLMATLPMTLVLEAGWRLLPAREQYPLLPSEIVTRLARGSRLAPLRTLQDERPHIFVTLLAHFGYGSAAGAGYALTTSALPLPPVARGLLFGVALWAVSYLGWLPSTEVLRPATQYPAGRNLLMIAAHLVWGAAVGALANRLNGTSRAR